MSKTRQLVIPPKLGSICMLCQTNTPIKNSHLWPKFTVNWLKENSSPYLRRGDTPNLRREDSTKFPLLCLECENRFSKFENDFSARVFKPFRSNPDLLGFKYGRWLSHFAISMTWRVLAVEFADFAQRSPEQTIAASQAFEHWRLYLLNESLKIRPYRHHIFFFTELKLDSPGTIHAPDNLHTYVHRSLDGAAATFQNRGIVFSLIPGILFWSPIHPKDDQGWPTGSAIAEKGYIATGQQVSDERLGNLIRDSAKLAGASTLSDRQQNIVNQEYRKVCAEKSPEELSKLLQPIIKDRELKQVKSIKRRFLNSKNP